MPKAPSPYTKGDIKALADLGYASRIVAKGAWPSMHYTEIDERVQTLLLESCVVETENEARGEDKSLALGQISSNLLGGHELTAEATAAFEERVASRLGTEPNSRGIQSRLQDTEFFLIHRGPVTRPSIGSIPKVYSISKVRELTSQIMAVTAGDSFLRSQETMLKQVQAIAARHPDQGALAFACMLEQAQRSLGNVAHDAYSAIAKMFDNDEEKTNSFWATVQASLPAAEKRVAITPTRVNGTGAGPRKSVDPQLAIVAAA